MFRNSGLKDPGLKVIYICVAKRQCLVDTNLHHRALGDVPSKGLWRIVGRGPAFPEGLRTGGAIMEAQLVALVSLMGETNTLGFSNCWVTSCFLPGRVQRGRGLPGQPSLFIAHVSCEHRGVQRRKGPVV